ncbi:hypothetical protein VM98_37625, partial [Streptomyces rubellomurinus subsp. indigoferus]
MPKNLYTPVPDGLAPQHAAFGTVGSIALHGVRQGEPKPGERALECAGARRWGGSEGEGSGWAATTPPRGAVRGVASRVSVGARAIASAASPGWGDAVGTPGGG